MMPSHFGTAEPATLGDRPGHDRRPPAPFARRASSGNTSAAEQRNAGASTGTSHDVAWTPLTSGRLAGPTGGPGPVASPRFATAHTVRRDGARYEVRRASLPGVYRGLARGQRVPEGDTGGAVARGSHEAARATTRQVQFIRALAREYGLEQERLDRGARQLFGASVAALSRQEAAVLIDRLGRALDAVA